MFSVSKIRLDVISALILMSVAVLQAQSENEILVGKVSPGEIDMSAFTLSESAEIEIQGTAATFGHWDEEMAFYGWILNSETRRVVWHLRDESDYDEDEGEFVFEATIDLEPGSYEVYYGGSVRNFTKITGWGDFWSNIFGKNKYKASLRRSLYMKVIGPKDDFEIVSPARLVDDKVENAIVSITRVGDYEDYERNFTLTEDVRIHIYALGEGRNGTLYDFAWIYDENNHERFWTMDSRRADHAGGGKKNIVSDRELTLPAGSYSVKYTSDDSHSYDEWNVLPPNDPQFYGITIWAVNESDLDYVEEFSPEDRVEPVVEIIRVGDDEFRSQGFSLKKDMELKVFCLGEGTSSSLADYGWIIDADTKETVWKMTMRRTENGGGADKNRMFDGSIDLPDGNYIAFYVTDGSHSYRDWNASRPLDPERWGLTIWAADKDEREYVELFNEDDYRNDNVLAELTRVRDHKEVSKKFELEDVRKVRIIALGEGDRGGMYDYGWIENDRGRIIWEMTYRKTDKAGGAKKNRMFNSTIMLDAGTYYVHFKTDDTHSYNDWNAEPPDNPELYGITVLLEE